MVPATAQRLNARDEGLDIDSLICGLELEEERLKNERPEDTYFERFFVNLDNYPILPREELIGSFQCRRVRMATWNSDRQKVVLTNTICSPDCTQCNSGEFENCKIYDHSVSERVVEYVREDPKKNQTNYLPSPPAKKKKSTLIEEFKSLFTGKETEEENETEEQIDDRSTQRRNVYEEEPKKILSDSQTWTALFSQQIRLASIENRQSSCFSKNRRNEAKE
ncbi:Oidioi.mRNA.OKI2018_I69.chr2.g5201.t1.cds [Oikopleura dioica]|uniref:Oidioi.mRNA.OKI2018_I69.chr2.g5201.t1.cds n=1 Tax=Oikopleura dioica TaxID=34765 RepID=A0ABN7SZS6_OIKDI|nr:Oidioi.mRNA.OKI2018_I69.chr2.g5201.t1.cds [Oikopleura dioica]